MMAPSAAPAAFRDHIAHVVRVGAEKKMVWSNTRGGIAAGAVVTDMHAGWDWAIVKLPGYAVGEQVLMPPPYSTVAVAHTLAGPKPARFRFSYPGPKSFGQGDTRPFLRYAPTRLAAKSTPTAQNPVAFLMELCATCFARAEKSSGECVILWMHAEAPFRCVSPRAVDSSAGDSSRTNFIIFGRADG